jgi:hypothetical protein
MKKASEHHEHATECRLLAASAKGEHRAMLLKMAETWDSLARDREDQLAGSSGSSPSQRK